MQPTETPTSGEDPTPLCRLAVRARDGDRAALAELLRGLQDTLWRFCLSQLASRDAAEEAVQETAARIVSGIDRFAGRSQAKTWALGIALNVCREQRRRCGGADRLIDDVVDPRPGVTSRLEASECAVSLQQEIADLPERQREAIVLRYFEQLSVDATASVMGCSPGTVKATVWQALRRLRQQMTPTGSATHE